MARPAKDLTGQKFGRLTVLEWAGRNKSSANLWKCRCDCGKEKIIIGQSITSGMTKSCGCYSRDSVIERNTTHKLCDTRVYSIWDGMKQRCGNPKYPSFEDYGGRGISVCPEWRDSFENFYDWAKTHGYRDGLTIDRIDNDGNYEPSNCRWATMKEQSNNRRSNHIIIFNDEAHTIAEWEAITGIKQSTISTRLQRKWSVERALTTPVRKQK